MTAAERLDALGARMDASDEILAVWLPESDEDAQAAE